MSETQTEFSSPDLGFIPPSTRLYHRTEEHQMPRFRIFGSGSLGQSLANLLRQMGFSVIETYDNDAWEKRNMMNTVGLSADQIGEAKGDVGNYNIQQMDHLPISSPGPAGTVIILATDNLLTRSAIMNMYLGQIPIYNTNSRLIDMRSSVDLSRCIYFSSPRSAQEAFNQENSVFPTLYPAVEYIAPDVDEDEDEMDWDPNIHGWRFVEGNPDNEINEGNCGMRGSMLHTITANQMALRMIFSMFQRQFHRKFMMVDHQLWTGNITTMAQGELVNPPEEGEEGLQNYLPEYSNYDPVYNAGNPIVDTVVNAAWAQELLSSQP